MRDRGRLLGVAVLVLAAVWLLAPALTTSRVLSSNAELYGRAPLSAHAPSPDRDDVNVFTGDAAFLYGPHLLQARRDIRAGRLPAWHPYVGAGRPLGAGQAAPFLPLNWPAFVLPFSSALEWTALLKVLTAALGMFLLCIACGLGPAAATFGGLAFALGFPFVAFLQSAHSQAFALLPWMLLATEALCRRGGAAPALVLGLFAGGCLLAGHPESALLSLLTVVAWATIKLGGSVRDGGLGRREALARAGTVAAGLALGSAVAAVALLPLVELLGQSYRPSREHAADRLKELLAGLAFPEYRGRPDKGFMLASGEQISGVFTGRPYAGALPLALAGVALAARPRARAGWLVAGAAVALITAAGVGPLRGVLEALPLIGIVNLHDLVWLAAFALALAGAIGIQRMMDAPTELRGRLLIVLAGVAVLPPLVYVASHPGILDAWSQAVRQVPTLRASTTSPDVAALGAVLRWCGLLAALLVAAWALRGRALWRAGIALVAVGLTCVDLVTLGFGFHSAIPRRVAEPTATPSLARLAAAGPATRFAGLDAALQPNTAELFGVRDVRVEDLPELERYTRLFTTLGGRADRLFGLTLVPSESTRAGELLDVFGARYVLDDGRASAPHGLVPVLARRGERLLRNPGAFPRAWVAHAWRPARGLDDALTGVAAGPTAGLVRVPIVEGVGASRAPALPTGPATIVEETDGGTRLRVEIVARRKGLLILNDLHYPGWRAEVDGRETTIHAANVAFRAVDVPAGRHLVTFAYRPLALRAGAIVTLFSLLAIVAGLVLLRRRRA